MVDKVLEEIKAEREYQIEKWGTDADVKLNTPNDFVSYISHHASKWFNGGFEPYNSDVVDAYRKQMIKVAALAVAAVEALDAQRVTEGKAFFENS